MNTYSQIVSKNFVQFAANPLAIRFGFLLLPFVLALGAALLTANSVHACPTDSGGCTIGN